MSENCSTKIFYLSLVLFTQIKIDIGNCNTTRLGIKNTKAKIGTPVVQQKKNISDNDPEKEFDGIFKLYVQKKEKPLDESQEAMQRKSRDTSNEGLECLSCYGEGISAADENCYKGSGISTQKCLEAEKCYIELHPLYIKRGCVLPGSLNRTFVCKCPLCNDKPSYDSAYYEYTKLSDWEYDNERLKKPPMLENLMCKICETKGVNKISDNFCKSGLRTDLVICNRGEYCFTNIDEQTDFVSRGCIKRPAYNKFYKFCDNILCNNIPMLYPYTKVMEPQNIEIRSITISSSLSSCVDKLNSKFYFLLLFFAIQFTY